MFYAEVFRSLPMEVAVAAQTLPRQYKCVQIPRSVLL